MLRTSWSSQSVTSMVLSSAILQRSSLTTMPLTSNYSRIILTMLLKTSRSCLCLFWVEMQKTTSLQSHFQEGVVAEEVAATACVARTVASLLS